MVLYRLRSLNVAGKVVVVAVAAGCCCFSCFFVYTDVVVVVTLHLLQEMFFCFVVVGLFACLLVDAAVVGGFWKFTAYRPSLLASPQW